ncbi:MAG: Unknown protein [uncultured Sulfurovum sp.]|uniref:Uncharacterized protein n=1 Tax=uncultured Sulfurovum sp. TaxID=269237 RepID=A0A6S6SZR6_9BACT|nr:MAG: Unknown protein [uncultured Sulfurovum sp.]
MDSLLEQKSHFNCLSTGLNRKGPPQFLQVKLMDLNFNVLTTYIFGKGGGMVLKFFSRMLCASTQSFNPSVHINVCL